MTRSSFRLRPSLLVTMVLAACGGDSTDTPEPTVDPRLGTWRTDLSGRYVRVVETTDGSPVTTWPKPDLIDLSQGQEVPAYSDVQRVRTSDDFVYVDATGMASHQMGPWYFDAATLFGNWPRAQGYVFKIPRVPQEVVAPAVNVTHGLGAIGAWVNGVPIFNQLDGFGYDTAMGRENRVGMAPDAFSNTTFAWIREAIAVEGPTLDSSNAHQPGGGDYHYHANPLGLRYQLGDNLQYDATTGLYSEISGEKKHSPILAWAYDGYPIYGPYGYTDCAATATSTAVSRMRSGFVLRDGRNGTTNLATEGRKSLGQWAATMHTFTTAADDAGHVPLPETAYGPNVDAYFYIGRYNEDYEYLGDMGEEQGSTYDLDQFNARFCRTPEYPDGIWAYHVTIDAAGKAVFPYTVGRQYRGQPLGATLVEADIDEPLTDFASGVLAGGVKLESSKVANGWQVEWSTAEGATYQLESSTDGGTTWSVVASDIKAVSPSGDTTPGGTGLYTFASQRASFVDERSYASDPTYRATITATEPYTFVKTATYWARIVGVAPAAGARGSTVRVKVDLKGNQPGGDNTVLNSDQPTSFEIVTLDGATIIATATNVVRILNITEGDFVIPADATPGSYMVRVNYPRPGNYQSVDQTNGLDAALIAPSPTVYPDLPFTIN